MALNPVYVLSSDDPLLKNDKAREIVEQARRELPEAAFMLFTHSDFASTRGANLAALENELIDPGLFGGDRLIKIYLKDLDATAVEVLNLIARRWRPGVCIIIDLPRLNSAFIKEKPLPFKEEPKLKLETRKKHALAFIKGIGGSVEILYTPEGTELLNFIAARCQRYGFTLDRQAANYLAMACEGNLISIDQSLQIMQMTQKQGTIITVAEVDRFFSQDARFTGFEFTEALLNGESLRALNVLDAFCNGPGSSLSSALALLLGRLDGALSAVREGKGVNLSAPAERTRFMLSHGIKTPRAQQAVLKALNAMPVTLLNFLTLSLSKAAKDFSSFNHEHAYLTLQQMAVSMSNFQAMELEGR